MGSRNAKQRANLVRWGTIFIALLAGVALLVLAALAADLRQGGLSLGIFSPTASSPATPQPPATAAPPATDAPTAARPAATVWPSSTPQPPVCRETQGRITHHTLESALLPLPLEFRVYTPPCYRQTPNQTYPVLYLIHGQSFNDDQWDRLGADEAASRLISLGEIPPFLIVMPRDRVWTQPREDPFGQALVAELIPWVEQNYRARPERAYRAIGGLSRGGGWALHLGLSYPELFSAIGGHSLAIFNQDAPLNLTRWLEEIPPEQFPRLYLDMGDRDREEIRRSMIWFEKLLTAHSIPHTWRLNVGFHDEDYWAAHVEEYLRWYAEAWEK